MFKQLGLTFLGRAGTIIVVFIFFFCKNKTTETLKDLVSLRRAKQLCRRTFQPAPQEVINAFIPQTYPVLWASAPEVTPLGTPSLPAPGRAGLAPGPSPPAGCPCSPDPTRVPERAVAARLCPISLSKSHCALAQGMLGTQTKGFKVIVSQMSWTPQMSGEEIQKLGWGGHARPRGRQRHGEACTGVVTSCPYTFCLPSTPFRTP